MDLPGAAPARLGRYELLARLASGGMGEIFLARLEGAAGFEKLFVIKRILPHLAGDVRFRAMLIGEARIASMMTHANVCQVYELGETDGQLYIVMEYLEGSTMLPLLRKLSKQGLALDLGFIAGVIQQATDGLHYAHELKERSGEYLGIVHRDVTPSNIFVTEAGVVKVLDFGIAKVKNASAQTQTGTVKGKYAYMAPEQLRGAVIDRRADVFALGVVLYEMLALRRLFQRKTDYLTFRAVMEQPIMDIRHYRPDCPVPLANTLLCALDREPGNRFGNARQFGAAVMDAVAPFRRPWTQGEISDFVVAQFADELRLRSAQISAAVNSGARLTMLELAQPDDESLLEDSEPDFAPVDSEITETPVDVRHIRGPSDEHTAVNDPGPGLSPVPLGHPGHQGPLGPGMPGIAPMAAVGPMMPVAPPLERVVQVQTPPPGPSSQPQSIVVVQGRRSVLWPVVAFAMVLVSGGALFLVWRQTQNQPAPQTLLITTDTGAATGSGSGVVIVGPNTSATATPRTPGPAPDTTTGSGDAASAPAIGSDGQDPGSAQPPPVRPGPAAQARNAETAEDKARRRAVDRQKDALERCVAEHGNLPAGAVVEFVVGPDGHAARVGLTPAEIDGTPLGGCIKGVFRAAVFPYNAGGDNELRVTLRPPGSRRTP